MILPRQFNLAEENDYEKIAAASGRLRALLDAFSGNILPPEYGQEQLAVYARSLLSVQREDGSFASFSRPEILESDVRTDAHRFVTWSAIAFLCCFQKTYGDARILSRKKLIDRICAAMRSPLASDFTFPESGDAEPIQQVEAVFILASGGIPYRLKMDPSLAPAMNDALFSLETVFRHRLAQGNTVLPGGIEYKNLFRKALEALVV